MFRIVLLFLLSFFFYFFVVSISIELHCFFDALHAYVLSSSIERNGGGGVEDVRS